MEKPTYYGTWKGRVIESIVMDGARSWEDIQEISGLNPKQLNIVLRELFNVGALEKTDKFPYKVEYDLYKKYKAYLENRPAEKIARPKTRVKKGQQVETRGYITEWLRMKNLSRSLDKQHFFLEGRYLDELSKDIITGANSEILIVNPFVTETDLAKTMINPSKKGVKVTLITRPNSDKIVKAFHGALKKANIHIIYNKTVHAKIIVVDKAVAFVSSMNFIPTSSAGQSWEAGMVSMDENVISDILDSIFQIIEN